MAHRQDPVVNPGKVTHHHIQDFLAELVERTSAGNAHTNYRGLRTFWKWMVLEEEVEHSPMEKTKPPQVLEKPIPVIPDGDVKALLDACQGRDFVSRRDASAEEGEAPEDVATLADASQPRNTAEQVMWGHYQRAIKAGRHVPTGAELDKVANTNNYGRAVLRKWRRTRKVE